MSIRSIIFRIIFVIFSAVIFLKIGCFVWNYIPNCLNQCSSNFVKVTTLIIALVLVFNLIIAWFFILLKTKLFQLLKNIFKKESQKTHEYDEDYEEYRIELLEYRSKVRKQYDQINNEYNRLIVFLSGGAIALSITFLAFFIGSQDKSLLYIDIFLESWVLLIISLFATLLGLFFGLRAREKGIKQIDTAIIYYEDEHLREFGGLWSLVADIVHITSLLTCITGIAMLLLFTYLNVPT